MNWVVHFSGDLRVRVTHLGPGGPSGPLPPCVASCHARAVYEPVYPGHPDLEARRLDEPSQDCDSTGTFAPRS